MSFFPDKNDLFEPPAPANINLSMTLIPLINVIFLLMVFFLVAGTIKSPDLLQINVPDARSGEATEEHTLTLLLNRQGDLVLDNTIVSESMLRSTLQYNIRQRPYQLITIKAAEEMPVDQLLKLMNLVTELGGTNVVIVTENL